MSHYVNPGLSSSIGSVLDRMVVALSELSENQAISAEDRVMLLDLLTRVSDPAVQEGGIPAMLAVLVGYKEWIIKFLVDIINLGSATATAEFQGSVSEELTNLVERLDDVLTALGAEGLLGDTGPIYANIQVIIDFIIDAVGNRAVLGVPNILSGINFINEELDIVSDRVNSLILQMQNPDDLSTAGSMLASMDENLETIVEDVDLLNDIAENIDDMHDAIPEVHSVQGSDSRPAAITSPAESGVYFSLLTTLNYGGKGVAYIIYNADPSAPLPRFRFYNESGAQIGATLVMAQADAISSGGNYYIAPIDLLIPQNTRYVQCDPLDLADVDGNSCALNYQTSV